MRGTVPLHMPLRTCGKLRSARSEPSNGLAKNLPTSKISFERDTWLALVKGEL